MRKVIDFIKKIPVIGYIFRLISNFFLLPKRLDFIQKYMNENTVNVQNDDALLEAIKVQNGEFDEKIKCIEENNFSQSKTIEQISENIKNDNQLFDAMKGQNEEFKEKIKCLEENYLNQLKSIEQISENIRDNNEIIQKLNRKYEEEIADESFFRKKTYSQCGEDAIISFMCIYLNISPEQVTYLDLGANHAVEMSNSYYFYEKGAHGVLVEANPELIGELKAARPRDIVLNKAISFEEDESQIPFYVMSGDGLSTISYESAKAACEANPEIFIKQEYKIPTIRIDDLLEQYFSEANPTIMSIDLEGIEEKIIEQIDFDKYRPIIIIVEDIPYSPKLVVDSKEDKVKALLMKHGYTEYAFTGVNAIYLDLQYREKLYMNKE